MGLAPNHPNYSRPFWYWSPWWLGDTPFQETPIYNNTHMYTYIYIHMLTHIQKVPHDTLHIPWYTYLCSICVAQAFPKSRNVSICTLALLSFSGRPSTKWFWSHRTTPKEIDENSDINIISSLDNQCGTQHEYHQISFIHIYPLIYC